MTKLSHQVHFSIPVVEELIRVIALGFVFLHTFAIKRSDKSVQINAICQLLPKLVGAIPFEFCYISSYAYRTKLFPGYFSYNLTRHCQHLYFHILWDLASCKREYEGSGCT